MLLAQRLLDYYDAHGALLMELDYYPEHQLLHVRWHGHLTPATVVAGVRAAMALRQQNAAPRRLLDDKGAVSGDWTEALPWLQYEWLPPAVAAGMRAVAYVLPPDPTAQSSSLSFIEAVSQLVPAEAFHDAAAAHEWLLRQE